MGYNFQWKYWWQTDWSVCFWCLDSLYKSSNSRQKESWGYENCPQLLVVLGLFFDNFWGWFWILCIGSFWLMKSCKGFLKIFLKTFWILENKEQYIKYCSVLQNPEIADNYCAFGLCSIRWYKIIPLLSRSKTACRGFKSADFP